MNIYLYFRCQEWVQRSRRKDLIGKSVSYLYGNCKLCGEHFEINQFMNKDKRNKLIPAAVPSVFNVPNPPKKVTLTRPLPTKRAVVSSKGPPRKKRNIQSTSASISNDHLYCTSSHNSEHQMDIQLKNSETANEILPTINEKVIMDTSENEVAEFVEVVTEHQNRVAQHHVASSKPQYKFSQYSRSKKNQVYYYKKQLQILKKKIKELEKNRHKNIYLLKKLLQGPVSFSMAQLCHFFPLR